MNQRSGETLIKSVSVTQHFDKLINQYNISPTEAFRRGIAVTLFDLGITDYQSSKNKERFIFVEKYMKFLESEQDLLKTFQDIKDFEILRKSLPALKKVLELFDVPKVIEETEQ